MLMHILEHVLTWQSIWDFSVHIKYSCEKKSRKQNKSNPMGAFLEQWRSLYYARMEELGSALAAPYQQAHVSHTSMNGNIIRAQALPITAHFGVNRFTGSDGWIDRFKRGHNAVYRTPANESQSVDLDTVEEWKNG